MPTDTAAVRAPLRPRGRQRSTASRRQVAQVAAVAAVGAFAAAVMVDAAPTGWPAIDALYRAGFLAFCAYCGSRARRFVLVVSAGLVAIGSDGWDLLPAMAALVLTLVLAWRNLRERVAGSVAGALIGWAALHLSWPPADGGTALLAAAAVVPLGVSTYLVSRRAVRRRWVIGLVAVGSLVGLAGLSAAAFAVTQGPALFEAARDSVDAANDVADGAGSTAAGIFEDNASSFRAISGASTAWWMLPTRFVPGLSQNVRAVGVAAAAGADLNVAANELALSVDFEELQLDDGRIDLERLADFAEPVSSAAGSISGAQQALATLDSPWLLGALSEQLDEFAGHVGTAESAMLLADAAVEELPAILGADGPRRYLLLLGNPAEARDLGGHLGSWAEITAVDGKLDTVEVGDAYDLFGPGARPRPAISEGIDVPQSLRDMNPTVFPQNWGATPDLRATAALAADLYPQVRPGAPVDGVLYADPIAFAALLRLTGPVQHDGLRVGADDAVQFLTRDQFVDGEPSLSGLIRTALDQLLDGRLPTPKAFSAAFDEVVDAGHLQFTLLGGPSSTLELTGLDVEVRADPGEDTLLVLSSNANPSKIDAYLRRAIDHSVSWDPTSGDLAARTTVTLHNDAPSEGLHPVVIDSGPGATAGTNRTQLSVLSRHDLIGVMVDGEPVPWSTRSDVAGLRRYSVRVDVPPGGASSIVFDLSGRLEPSDRYTLRWYRQPLLQPDEARLVLRPRNSSLPGGAREGQVSIGSDRETLLSVELER